MSPVVPRFELAEEESGSGAHIVSVSGEIHLKTVPQLSERLSEALDAGHTALVLDMGGVEFIDSTGLSVLLAGLRRATQLQARMALVCANPTVLRLFQITSLDKTFDIFDDRASAIEHVLQAQPPAGGSSGEAP